MLGPPQYLESWGAGIQRTTLAFPIGPALPRTHTSSPTAGARNGPLVNDTSSLPSGSGTDKLWYKRGPPVPTARGAGTDGGASASVDRVVDEAGADVAPALDEEAAGLAPAGSPAADTDGAGTLDAQTGAALVQPTPPNAKLITATSFDGLVATRRCIMSRCEHSCRSRPPAPPGPGHADECQEQAHDGQQDPDTALKPAKPRMQFELALRCGSSPNRRPEVLCRPRRWSDACAETTDRATETTGRDQAKRVIATLRKG